MDCTTGLSDGVDDVALFTVVELEFEIDELYPTVRSDEFVCAYETNPLETKIMEIVASPNNIDCIDLFVMIRVYIVKVIINLL
jgi:hypothetical protein